MHTWNKNLSKLYCVLFQTLAFHRARSGRMSRWACAHEQLWAGTHLLIAYKRVLICSSRMTIFEHVLMSSYERVLICSSRMSGCSSAHRVWAYLSMCSGAVMSGWACAHEQLWACAHTLMQDEHMSMCSWAVMSMCSYAHRTKWAHAWTV